MFSRIPRHILVAMSAWGSRVVIAAVQLTLIRVSVQGLGTESYAVFAVLYALSGFYLLSDLGLGFSVQNSISERRALGNEYGRLLRFAVLCALALFSLEALLLFSASGWAGSHVLKQFVFLSYGRQRLLFFTAGILLLANGSGQVAYRIWYAEQRGYLSNILPAVAQVAGLLCVLVCLRLRLQPAIEWSLFAYLAPTACVALVSLAWLALRRKGSCSDSVVASELFRRAVGFGIFNLTAAVVLQVDFLIISQFLPPHQILVYSVISRIYAFVFVIYSSALLALWPVCTELATRNEWKALRHHLNRYMALGCLFVLAFTVILIWKSNLVVGLMAPNTGATIPGLLILAFGGYYLIRVWTDTFAMALQSMTILLPLWISVPIQASLSVALQWYFVPRFGLYGVLMGLVGSYIFTVAWVLPWVLHRLFIRRQTVSLKEDLVDEAVGLHSNL